MALDRARASPCDHHDAKELVRPPEVVVIEEKLQNRTKKEKGNAMRETRNIMGGTPSRETRARGLR